MVCAVCGRAAAAGEEGRARLTWARGLEHGRPRWLCAACSREHLRSIEGKLDFAWW